MKKRIPYLLVLYCFVLSATASFAQTAPNISYSPSTNSYLVGTAITTLTPANSGGAITVSGFGTGTSLSGPFTQPDGMAIDASGNVYSTNFNGTSGTIRLYNSSGIYQSNFGFALTDPVGLVFSPAGKAYVLDRGVSSVYVFYLGTIQTTITGFSSARGIAIDPSGANIYIANSGSTGTIFKYNISGGTTSTFINTGLNTPYGVATDASGNVYVVDNSNKAVYKYNSSGSLLSTFASGFSSPDAITVDAAGNVYVADPGNNVVDVYSSAGTLVTSITDSNTPDGLIVDSSGNLYVADTGNNTVTEYPPVYYHITGGSLPTGLSFNSITGSFSGTPTASFPATTYTITAYDGGVSNSTTVTLSCYKQFGWIGQVSSDWSDLNNWSPHQVPSSSDMAQFGVAFNYTNPPIVKTASASVGSIVFGNSAPATTITVNSGFTLTVNGDITNQSDNFSYNNYVHSFAGAGAVTANNLAIISNTSLPGHPYTETISSSVAQFNITNIKLTSNVIGGYVYNSTFNVTGGITKVSGTIQTANSAGSTSKVSVANATLQLTNAAALSGLSSLGTNVVTFNNAGATVEYAGAAQTVYTDGAITGLAGGVSYQNIKFSGTGIKTGATGNINIAGDFTNTLANDAANYADFSSPTVKFSGTTQSLSGGSGNGTTFYKVLFSGPGTKTIAAGNFYIASSGVLTMSGASASTILAANGLLTLNSDITGSATVAAYTGPKITGNVNVQRYISGGSAVYRSYRLLSSPVNAGTVSGNTIYSLNYVKLSSLITGTGGIPGGFDKTGNPSLYLFRDNLAQSNASFISGNFRGVSDISAAPSYSIDGDGSGFNIPVGNGFLFFFRGDRTSNVANKYLPGTVAESVTMTATGTLNAGQITVTPWFTPASANLDHTAVAGNSSMLGFNLVGNPYASSIDWDKMDSVSASTDPIYVKGVSKFIYILDPVSKNYNVYAAKSPFGAGTIALANSNIIPSGQGFFVQATTSASKLVFNESSKTNTQVSTTDQNLFLGTPVQAAVNQYMHLKLAKDAVNVDGIFIAFKSDAKPQFDATIDARYKIGNGEVSLASRSADNVNLAINTLPLPKQTATTIGLNVDAETDGIYNLSLTAIKSIPDLYEVWLMDAYKKDSLDIKHNPNYSFNILKSDAASFGAKRFSIVIRQDPALGVHLLNFAAAKTLKGAQINWKTENEVNYTNFTVERSTNSGITFEVIGGFASSSLGTYSLADKAPSLGSNRYRLKMEDLNGTISYSKVVTLMYNNPDNTITNNNIDVYPNPAINTINIALPQTTKTPTYGIQIVNNTGTVVTSATSAQQVWQSDVSKLLPGTYIIRVLNNTDNAVVGKSTFIKL